MSWTLEIEKKAEKSLAKLPKPVGKRIVGTLREVAKTENPRVRGRAMAGKYAGHWRYRIGDYRVIARIEDGLMVIVVIAIGHRRDIYR
ncbi:MAG: type II toxin-antitoxin system RelE/ParE family toxin [Sphingomonadaceae bacterium]|nr:type II toxin-antitoxin system RelE/ParE family toxin [Sphingomonadaceae bacterium]